MAAFIEYKIESGYTFLVETESMTGGVVMEKAELKFGLKAKGEAGQMEKLVMK